ncbi:hypothetical protein [Nonomuraea sp. NPDC049400]|uniref:hypothetical protein n=1 Tax=Nonomuraea sp. NPDC049400 TaxID=3364352 RepID=UPI00378C107B
MLSRNDTIEKRYGKPLDRQGPTRDCDAGRFPADTDPSVIQDILASSIGSILLRHEQGMTAAQIEA